MAATARPTRYTLPNVSDNLRRNGRGHGPLLTQRGPRRGIDNTPPRRAPCRSPALPGDRAAQLGSYQKLLREARRIAGMARSYFRPVQTLLTSVYMAMPSSPFSRPRPDIL